MAKTKSPTPELIDFNDFADAVTSGSARSRSILNSMMTAAFLAALAWFNARKAEQNWFPSRIQGLHNTYHWIVFPEDICTDSLYTPNGKFVLNKFELDSFKVLFNTIPALNHPVNDSVKSIPPHIRLKIPSFYIKEDRKIDTAKILQKQYVTALAQAGSMGITSRNEMENLIRLYNRGRIENSLLVKIPILGISFDVNWLAIFSGLAFSILFFLLYHSLARERKNLKLIFSLADERKIDKMSLYQLLSMQQVLTVPASINEYFKPKTEKKRALGLLYWNKFKNFMMRLFTLLPIVLPAIVWFEIYSYDNSTKDIGAMINPELTTWSSDVSDKLAYLLALFFIICLYEWFKIDQLWTRQAGKIKVILRNSGKREQDENTDN